MDPIAKTPVPPYYAGIFTSLRTPGDAGYAAMSERMVALAQAQPGHQQWYSAFTTRVAKVKRAYSL